MSKQTHLFHTLLGVNINEYSPYDDVLIAGDTSTLTAVQMSKTLQDSSTNRYISRPEFHAEAPSSS